MLVCLTCIVASRVGLSQEVLPQLPPYPLGPIVMLSGGGILSGELESISSERIVVLSSLIGRLELSRSLVSGYRSSMALGPRAPDHPASMKETKSVVRLVNGDMFRAASVAVSGGQLTAQSILTDLKSVVLPLKDIRAIDFPKTSNESDNTCEWMALVDGSRFCAPQIAQACTSHEIAAVLRDAGGFRLLQSLTPSVFVQDKKCLPQVVLSIGSTFNGGWASVRGLTSFTCLGVQAPASLRYQFDKPVRRFLCRAAIDDCSGQGGRVTLRISAFDVDGEKTLVFQSPILWGGDTPYVVDAEFSQAVEMEITMESESENMLLDRVVLLDPLVLFETSHK